MAAIFVGSLAGGAVGAGYLTAARSLHAPVVPQGVSVAAVGAPTGAGTGAPVPASTPTGLTPTAPPLPAASPFRFAAVARAATDQQCLTEAVYFEARGEPRSGQQAVAQVILNRVRHPAFPKTICAVVHQRTDAGCQFSFACSAEPRGRDETAWRRAQTIARDALHGTVMREVGDATHFENVRVAAFAGLLKVAQIGAHVFYRFGGHNGAPGMFHQTPAPSLTARLELASIAPVPRTAELSAPPSSAAIQTARVVSPASKPALIAAAVAAPLTPATQKTAVTPALAAAPVAFVPASAAQPVSKPQAETTVAS